MDAVCKALNSLPSASIRERLAESMDLTKSQVIKIIQFSPFSLDVFTLFSLSNNHPAFIWWVFSPVWRFSNQTAWKEFWNFNVAWQASHLKLLSKLFCDEIAKYPKEFSCSWMAVILVWGAQYVGEKLNDKGTRRWSNTVINIIHPLIIENGWTRLAFHLLDWVSTQPALHMLAAALWQCRLFVMLPGVARGHLYKKRCDILQKSVKRRQFLTSATTTTTTTTAVMYIFIFSTGYHLVSEPPQAGKRGKACTWTVQSALVTVNTAVNKQKNITNGFEILFRVIALFIWKNHNPFKYSIGSGLFK